MKALVPRRLMAAVAIGLVVLTLPAALVVAIAEWFPTSLFIELQARWNDGYYYQKLTFLLTWFALVLVVTTPMQLLAGAASILRGLFRRSPPLSRGSHTKVLLGRFVRLASGGVAGFLSLLLVGICLIRPDVLDPIGFLASILLLAAVVAPGIALLFFLDGLCPTEVVEGRVVAKPVIDVGRGPPTYQLTIDDVTVGVRNDVWSTVQIGDHVRVALTGYLGTCLALEHPERLGALD